MSDTEFLSKFERASEIPNVRPRGERWFISEMSIELTLLGGDIDIVWSFSLRRHESVSSPPPSSKSPYRFGIAVETNTIVIRGRR